MKGGAEWLKLYNETRKLLWKMKDIQGSAALITLEKYINGALIQQDRIKIDKQNILNRSKQKTKTLEQLLAIAHALTLNIHFYYICLDKCRSLFKFISDNEGDFDIQNLWKKYKKEFQPCRNIRNHLEHIEQRISKKRYLHDLGNVVGDSFKFGGKSFDIGKKSLSPFIDAYEELLAILHARFEQRP